MLDSLFVDDLHERFQIAGIKDSQNYNIGGISFAINYYGTIRHDNFGKAISHLASKKVSSEYTICVTDMRHGGVNLPKPKWNWDSLDKNGFIPTSRHDRFIARFMSWQNCFYLIDLFEKRAFFWVKNYDEMPEWERSFPFRDIFHHIFNSFEHFAIVHAAAVGNSIGGVLMPGRGGSGKSTAALSCLNSSLLYAGDDLVLVDFKNQFIYSLYNVAKLDENQFNIFPELKEQIYNSAALPLEKAQIFLSDFCPEKLICKMPFLGIILPRYLGAENTEYEESNTAKALLALAPSSIGLLKTDARYLNKLSNLIRGHKVIELNTGKELKQIPEKINIIIKSLNV